MSYQIKVGDQLKNKVGEARPITGINHNSRYPIRSNGVSFTLTGQYSIVEPSDCDLVLPDLQDEDILAQLEQELETITAKIAEIKARLPVVKKFWRNIYPGQYEQALDYNSREEAFTNRSHTSIGVLLITQTTHPDGLVYYTSELVK